MTTFHIDATGKLLRATSDPDVEIEGATLKTEVPPISGLQIWDFVFDKWGDVPTPAPDPLTTEELYDMLVSKGIVSDTDRPRPKPQGQP